MCPNWLSLEVAKFGCPGRAAVPAKQSRARHPSRSSQLLCGHLSSCAKCAVVHDYGKCCPEARSGYVLTKKKKQIGHILPRLLRYLGLGMLWLEEGEEGGAGGLLSGAPHTLRQHNPDIRRERGQCRG